MSFLLSPLDVLARTLDGLRILGIQPPTIHHSALRQILEAHPDIHAVWCTWTPQTEGQDTPESGSYWYRDGLDLSHLTLAKGSRTPHTGKTIAGRIGKHCILSHLTDSPVWITTECRPIFDKGILIATVGMDRLLDAPSVVRPLPTGDIKPVATQSFTTSCV